jgi:hypothetical protein
MTIEVIHYLTQPIEGLGSVIRLGYSRKTKGLDGDVQGTYTKNHRTDSSVLWFPFFNRYRNA